jgi:hypothetical protein
MASLNVSIAAENDGVTSLGNQIRNITDKAMADADGRHAVIA